MELRLTEDEAEILRKKADKARLTCSEYMRRLLLDREIHEAPPADYYKLITELRRVGSNINQLLKTAHTKGFIDTPLLRKTVEDYQSTERMLWSAFGEAKG